MLFFCAMEFILCEGSVHAPICNQISKCIVPFLNHAEFEVGKSFVGSKFTSLREHIRDAIEVFDVLFMALVLIELEMHHETMSSILQSFSITPQKLFCSQKLTVFDERIAKMFNR